jgi:hypothetical protein
MKISQLPKEVKEKALQYQKNSNSDYDKNTDNLIDAFHWDATEERECYWSDWNNKKFIKSKNYLDFMSFEDLDSLLSWKISQNHTKNWGCIKGKYSCTYSFMHKDKNEVIKWLINNYKL